MKFNYVGPVKCFTRMSAWFCNKKMSKCVKIELNAENIKLSVLYWVIYVFYMKLFENYGKIKKRFDHNFYETHFLKQTRLRKKFLCKQLQYRRNFKP